MSPLELPSIIASDLAPALFNSAPSSPTMPCSLSSELLPHLSFCPDGALVLQPLIFTPVLTSAGQQNDVTLQLFNGAADAYLVSASFTGPQGTAGFPAVRGGPVINGFVNVSFALTVAGAYTLSATVYTQGQTVSLTNGLNPAVIVTPGEAVAAQTRVLGLEPGRQLVAGTGVNFTVVTADTFGNTVTPNPGLNLTFSATFLASYQASTPSQFDATGLLFQQNSTQTLPITITQTGAASLVSSPIPQSVGTVTVSVNLSGTPLSGSPFFLPTIPGPPSPQKSTLSGAGLSGAIAGVPAEVILTPRDEFGNPMGSAGRLVTAILNPAGNGTATSLPPGFGSADVSDMVASAGGVASGPNVQPGVTVGNFLSWFFSAVLFASYLRFSLKYSLLRVVPDSFLPYLCSAFLFSRSSLCCASLAPFFLPTGNPRTHFSTFLSMTSRPKAKLTAALCASVLVSFPSDTLLMDIF